MRVPRISVAEAVRRAGAIRRLARDAAGVAPARPLAELTGFGSDPGDLRALCFVPDGLPRDGTAALVVALHGCTQTAAAYDRGCGWSVLAGREGFAVLLPEQRRGNNPNLCFNWFEPGDASRDRGEVASVRQMIAAIVERHGLDPRRVFITGLSAGGAMVASLLAAYPELFGGGAIVAGLPHGAAASVGEAFEAMRGGCSRSARSLGAAVRAASPLPPGAARPPVSIWHGDADGTVAVGNADGLARQWADAHGLAEAPDEVRAEGRDTRATWRGRDGWVAVERHVIAGMGHGVPLRPGEGVGECGAAGPFLLDVGVASTLRIAEDWGLVGAGRGGLAPSPRAARQEAVPPGGRVAPGRVVAVDAAGAARVEGGPAEAGMVAGVAPVTGAGRGPGGPAKGPGGIVGDALALAANAHRMTPSEIVRDALAMAGLRSRR